MKKCTKIILIFAIILIALISINTKSYANTVSLIKNEKLQNANLAGINSQIKSKLSRYGYPANQEFEKGRNNITWTKENVQYTVIIEIKEEQPKVLYSGTIVELKSTTKDNSEQAPDGTITSSGANSSVDPIENPDYYMPTDTTGKNTKLIDIGNTIVGAIRIIGTVIAVVSLMVIGLRYMVGSTEEKANYKETMIPYLIGAVMIFTIPNLLGIIYDLVKSINF